MSCHAVGSILIHRSFVTVRVNRSFCVPGKTCIVVMLRLDPETEQGTAGVSIPVAEQYISSMKLGFEYCASDAAHVGAVLEADGIDEEQQMERVHSYIDGEPIRRKRRRACWFLHVVE